MSSPAEHTTPEAPDESEKGTANAAPSTSALYTTYSSVDAIGDVPDTTRAAVTGSQERVLENMFGVKLGLQGNDEISGKVSQKIFSIIGDVRTSVNAEELPGIINQKITQMMNDAEFETLLSEVRLDEPRRIQAVANAVFQAIPQDILEKFMALQGERQLFIDRGQITPIIKLPNTTTLRGASINLDHPFWKMHNFNKEEEIMQEIVGKKIEDIGIIPMFMTLRKGTRISTEIAIDLVRSTISHIAKPKEVADYSDTFSGIDFTVQLDKLCKDKTDDDAPLDLKNKYIAEMNLSSMVDILDYNSNSDARYFFRYIQLDDVNRAKFIKLSVSERYEMIRYIAEIIFEKYEVDAALPLGTKKISLLNLQKALHENEKQNTDVYTSLTKNSENYAGAAVASSFVQENPSLWEKVKTSTDKEKIKGDLSKVQAKLRILEMLGKLKDVKFQPRMKSLGVRNYKSGSVAEEVDSENKPVTLESLKKERNSLREDLAIDLANAKELEWKSVYATNQYERKPNSFKISDKERGDRNVEYKKEGEIQRARENLSSQKKDIDDEIERYIELEQYLLNLVYLCQKSDLKSANLDTYAKNIGSDTNLLKIADDVKKDLNIASEEDLKKEAEKHKAALKKAEEGGDTGDVLRMKIFVEHFKSQGMSPASAERAANYLDAKTLLDAELKTGQKELLDDLFQEYDGEEDSKKNMADKVLHELTGLLGVKKERRWKEGSQIIEAGEFSSYYKGEHNLSFNAWKTAPYSKLVSAYFSMKAMYDGKRTLYTNCAGSPTIRKEMRQVAEALAERHVHMLVTDFGINLNDEDRAKILSRKALSLDALEKILVGDAPAKYQRRVDGLLGHVDHRIGGSWPEKMSRAKNKVKDIAKFAVTKPFTATYGINSGFTGVGNQIKKNWKTAATLAALTVFGTPVAAAYKYATKKDDQNSHDILH